MENKFDGILLKMVEESKGYEGFFDLVFSMLRRKTDFFSQRSIAEKTIAQAGKKHITQYNEDKEKEKEKEKERERLKTEKARANMSKKDKQREIDEKRQKAAEELKKQRETEAIKLAKESASKDAAEDKKDAPKTGKLPPNEANGGDTDSYSWGQSLETVDVNIFVDANVKARDLIVELKKDSVKVVRKDGSKSYLEGKWFDVIDSEETFWTLEKSGEGKTLAISISKLPNQDKWWEYIVDGEMRIDTGKVNPEPSKLSDLDGEMRGEVEKMMFDMRQKKMGLPNSEEMKKREMLEKVMKANPNLNFDLSNAKFN